MSIDHISDTARWVAFYRAMETERPDAIFSDPYARRLAGLKGEEIVDTVRRGRMMSWAMIVRTAAFDEMIMSCITEKGADTVLNLGAGLDARPWRLNVPSTIRWFDADLPEILSYKTKTLRGERPRCRYETVSVDVTDEKARRDLFMHVGQVGHKVLVVSEGLLIYLTRQQVEGLAEDLANQPNFYWWLIDVASPRLLKIMLRTWGKSVEKGNAPFRFAPAEGTDFYRPLGWSEAEFRSSIDEARRLNREMKLMSLWRFMLRFRSRKTREEIRRMSAFVLLERNDVTQTWETERKVKGPKT